MLTINDLHHEVILSSSSATKVVGGMDCTTASDLGSLAISVGQALTGIGGALGSNSMVDLGNAIIRHGAGDLYTGCNPK